uniref:STIL centriolar assembly protein n=1 Tax=Stegastes partitus TaxID=144197 RepID=A0A3B5BLT1_9TELE
MLKVQGCVFCSQQSDAATFSISWSAVCPSVNVDIEPVRAIPIIPTALLRGLTSINQPLAASRQRGFVTMDQTRKLLLLLESDPKASSLPLVGIWLSEVAHAYNPQVWAWCLRFMFSLTLQDRVLTENSSFLLVLFGSTHKAPQFFQCRAPRPGPQLDCQLLTAAHSFTLYQQVAPVDGQSLQCELGSEVRSRQMEVFREAQSTFSSASTPIAGLSISDQDSGVEDEDLSPRPSPSPHPPAQQTRRVQPCVPELSLLIDGSFTSSHNGGQDRGYALRPSARKPDPPAGPTAASSSAPRPPPPHFHSTPNSNLQQPCTCCSTHTYDCTPMLSSPGLLPAAAPPTSHPDTPPSASSCPAVPSVPPDSAHKLSPPWVSHHAPAHHHTSPGPPSTVHYTPPSSKPSPNCPCSHPPPPPPPWCAASNSPHPSCPRGASPVASPWLPCPSCVTQCHDPAGGMVLSDTYQLVLHQDHQLRLLQAQVQVLLEAQGKLQSSRQQVDTQTCRSTASIAVGTGASLFWGDPGQPFSHQEVHAFPPSSPSPPSSPNPPSSTTSSSSTFSRGTSVNRSVGGGKDGDLQGQKTLCPPFGQHSISALQSPVLGESASMYRPADEQQSFYHNLMSQLTSRLQKSDSKEELESRRKSVSVVSDHSHCFQPSESSSLPTRKQQQQQRRTPAGDPVVSATLRQLQQLGVDVDKETLTEFDKNRLKAVESASTLASINPAAVVSRLSLSEPSALFPGGSVDLSLEANTIALRYLSDSQLSRLSLGGHLPQCGPSSNDSLLSPSNMSLATRKYMRKYGLIEEEAEEKDDEDEDEEEEEQQQHKEVRIQEASERQLLTETQNVKLLPQSHLIKDLQPKMQLLAGSAKAENRPPSSVRASSRQTEGSVGNILDLSRLRQLSKLF